MKTSVRETTHLQEWTNTQAVMNWFTDLKDKSDKTLIKFDIVMFYSFISQKLVNREINYAKCISAIIEQQESIVLHSKKYLLFNEKSTWTNYVPSATERPLGTIHEEKRISFRFWVSISSQYELSCYSDIKPQTFLPFFNMDKER